MANFKGPGIIIIDKIMKAKGPIIRAAFLQTLSQEEKKWLETTTPETWVPIAIATTLSKKAAQILFPNDPEALFKLGEIRAQENARGFYRVFMWVLSVETIIRNSAKLWLHHHDTGQAFLETADDRKNHLFYCVSNYPDLPAEFRKLIAGFIKGLMEISGAKNVRSQAIENNPELWKWSLTWD